MLRHDGLEFGPDEGHHLALAGNDLAMEGGLNHVKGDWVEYAGTFGLKGWADLLYPCFKCHATQANWHDDEDLTVLEAPWEDATDDDYNLACSRCEHVKTLTRCQYFQAKFCETPLVNRLIFTNPFK